MCFRRLSSIHAVYSEREISDYAKLTVIIWSFSLTSLVISSYSGYWHKVLQFEVYSGFFCEI